MKTTLEITDDLLRQAKRLAARERTTVRALVERGLRRELAERARRGEFRLRQVTVRGNGLCAGLDYSWDRLSGLVYEGRGG